MGLLAEVADKTGGIVNIVDPLNLRNEFTSILEDQIIATNVSAKFLLHKALFVKGIVTALRINQTNTW